ncbi:arsenite efflux ATP-binding protein ArsA [Natronoarchaeum philippinense]|uniref:Arsenite efflux ATP-binding protein ArsA n=1 Tax=Natronoarchaeum philippinense TaxID=558529 RepID=A0A285P7G0_NATPI|nr:ArsA family ATPase [Natronoarchaeum philippinense]SNZ17664.1 arsenite efflux ATP-binding protein ArsA [Natronoarchaeum philippinense]
MTGSDAMGGPSERFVFFGGKGGVGKTTVSSAFAVGCAEAGLDTLLVSTDPAHSTADVFDQPFGDDPRPVDGRERLWAMEIDPDAEIEAHVAQIRRSLSDQMSPAIVNEIDRQIELAHRTPGAHEAALFDRFIEVMRSSDEYDRVVFDTSPTGGTLRLLSLPELLESWIDRLVRKRTESIDRYEKAAIGERQAPSVDDDPIITRLRERKENFEFAGRVLRDDAAFFFVLNPDDLSIRETERAIENLDEYDLSVRGLVVNRLTPAPDDDEDGRGARFLRARRETERERLATIESTFEAPVVAAIETRVEEIRGGHLDAVAEALDIEPAPAASPESNRE